MKEKDELDDLLDITSVVSATECTGLMYIPPLDESEAESYQELYSVPKQTNNSGKINSTKKNK